MKKIFKLMMSFCFEPKQANRSYMWLLVFLFYLSAPVFLSAQQENENEKSVRFVSYNLKNYLTMKRYKDGKSQHGSKPEEEVRALVSLLKEAHPDIIGISEIGTKKDLKDLHTRLKEAGLNYPHIRHAFGSDDTRALAILSRYPILSHDKVKDTSYTLEGKLFEVGRGFLDTTIQLPNKKVRFIGVHLKSKRSIREADQEDMRRNEATLLRKHIDAIRDSSPEIELCVYGDFNDTKRSKALYEILGRSNSNKRLVMLQIGDSRGETWTHYWNREDIYSRIDFVLVSQSLTPYIDLDKSRILDHENWQLASDHRALLVLIK